MNLFLAVACSYLVIALLGYALGYLAAEFQHHGQEITTWPLPDLDPWAEPAPAYDWQREGTG